MGLTEQEPFHQTQVHMDQFKAANAFAHHIAVHDADLAIRPPESYLFIQDGLILACAICWTLAYIELVLATWRHRKCPIPIHVL